MAFDLLIRYLQSNVSSLSAACVSRLKIKPSVSAVFAKTISSLESVLKETQIAHNRCLKMSASNLVFFSSGSQCRYLSHEPSSLFHHSVLVDLIVSMMMH